MGSVHADMCMIRDTVIDQGCNPDGFTGALTPLSWAVDEIKDLVGQAFNDALSKLVGTGEGLCATAEKYGSMEEGGTKSFRSPTLGVAE